MINCPYDVPPFDPGDQRPKITFWWWSWHPNYPYWAKSCWGGETEDAAWSELAAPFASSLRLYHNKLIREGDGTMTEVADVPCQEMAVWVKIAEQPLDRFDRYGRTVAVPRDPS